MTGIFSFFMGGRMKEEERGGRNFVCTFVSHPPILLYSSISVFLESPLLVFVDLENIKGFPVFSF